jgi:ubiquinone/menaquinone biosynthesis C-methylase UbiE
LSRSFQNEAELVRQRYQRREQTVPAGRYSHFNPGSLFLYQQRERALLALFKREGLTELAGLRVLDLGCGHGMWLRDLVRYGAKPSDLTGTDIIGHRLQASRQLSPNIPLALADGSFLPFRTGSFDMVLQATVLTSVLDKGTRQRMAREMMRVLKPRGAIIWYDFRYHNPNNPDVMGIPRGLIRELFPDCRISLKVITLLPPLARFVAPAGRWWCEFFSLLPPLRTHYIGTIRPKPEMK